MIGEQSVKLQSECDAGMIGLLPRIRLDYRKPVAGEGMHMRGCHPEHPRGICALKYVNSSSLGRATSIEVCKPRSQEVISAGVESTQVGV